MNQKPAVDEANNKTSQTLNAGTCSAGKLAIAKWSLALGIVSVPLLGQESTGRLLTIPVSVAAVICGHLAMRRIRKSARRLRGRGLAIAGLILGYLACVTILAEPLVTMARRAALQRAAKSLVGLPVPTFALKRSDGASVSSASLKGSVYLLDFGPGPDSLRKLDVFAKRYKADGLRAFAVVSEDVGHRASAFARANGFDIPVLLASETGKTAEAFHARNNPETVLVGRDGRVLGVFYGATYAGEMEEAVKFALTTK